MIHAPDVFWTLPFLLYAETHYRFKYFFSALRKSEPELIADIPHRLEPGEDIPLLILAKDADRYPCQLARVRVELSQNGNVKREFTPQGLPIELNKALWWKIFNIQRTGLTGWVDLRVFMTLQRAGISRTYATDNHRTSSHKPLRMYLSPSPLPRIKGLHLGDAHTHSDKTSDQVEFGIPVHAGVSLAQRMGLSFYCIADHSYDLDDAPDDYAVNDPSVPKWNELAKEIATVRSREKGVAVIRGEEVSCRNADEKNVHFLLLGDGQFFHGSGDGAENWFQTRSENSISDVLARKEKRSVAYAAHPMEPVPFLQRLLLDRGSWSLKDFSHDHLSGIQFANGMKGSGFDRGYRAWIQMLLKGHQIYCLAGNDAHGNFNRFRQIGIPFFTIRERDEQLFGKMKTGVYLQGRLNESNILRALAQGTSIITDGPCLNVLATNERKSPTSIGAVFKRGGSDLLITGRSTPEFGPISSIVVFQGVVGESEERVMLSERVNGAFEYTQRIKAPTSAHCYLRIELHTSASNESDKRAHFCYTNPLWFMNSGGRSS